MIDTAELNARTDLLSLAGQRVDLRKVSGSEYAGPCPKCGGDDRFHVDSEKRWWFCRQCYDMQNGQPHDAIAFVRWLHGVEFKEACQMLGADSAAHGPKARPAHKPRPTLPPTETPGDAWQKAAESFVAFAETRLWQTPEALAYLVDRGISETTIKAARLGWNPRTQWRKPGKWGFDGTRKVWLPAGWTLPCWMDGQLQYVKVRRPDAELEAAKRWNAAHPKAKHRPDDKYVAIKGSKKSGVLYGLDDAPACQDVIICEGEYDALLLRQEIGDMAAVVATGAAGARPGAEALRQMVLYRRFWIALDTDNAGQGGTDRWAGLSHRVRLMPPPEHDVTDAWKAGHDLASWVQDAIAPEKSAAVPVSAEKGYTYVPFESPKRVQIEDYTQRLAHDLGGVWGEIPAPELEPSYAWCANGHCFYESDKGQIVSAPKH